MSSPSHQTRGLRGLVVGLALFGLACGIFLWGPSQEKEGLHVAPDAMGWIQYEKQGQKVRLEGSGQGWRVVAPYVSKADREVIGWMRAAFLDLDATWAPLDGASEDLEVYGLGEGAVALTGGMGEVTIHDWRIGDPLVTGAGSYVASREGVVGTTEAHWANLLALSVEDLRDHHAFDVAPGKVRRVTMMGPSGVLSVTGEGKDWWVRGYGRADPSRVDALVMGLLDIRVDGWDGEADEPSDFAHHVEVATVDGHVYRMLTESLEGPEVGVWLGRGVMGWIGTPALGLLAQGPGDIGAREVWPVREPTAVRVRGANFDRQYSPDDAGWVDASSGARLPEGAVAALLGFTIDYAVPPRPGVVEGCDVGVDGKDASARAWLSRSAQSGRMYATDRKGGQALPLHLPSSESVWSLLCTGL